MTEDNTIAYFYYEASTGKLMQTGACLPQDIDLQTPPNETWSKGIGTASLFDDYFSLVDQVIKTYPAKPSKYHEFDYQSEAWYATTLALEAAKTDKKAEIDSWRAEQEVLPILFREALFDADAKAQANISAWLNVINAGAELPAGFVWRDFNNEDHAADAQFVRELATALTMRGTALYAAAWEHKAAISKLVTLADVLSYQIQ